LFKRTVEGFVYIPEHIEMIAPVWT
jgi:hypothetical protein